MTSRHGVATGARRPVTVDFQAIQSPTTRSRGIGRYALDWALAIESADPDLVETYLLNPNLAPPGRIDELVATGKVAYRDAATDLSGTAIWHCVSPLDLALHLGDVAPTAVLASGARWSATVYDLIPGLDPEGELADPGDRRHYRTRLELLRFADGLLALSGGVARDLEHLVGIEADRISVVGAAPRAGFVPPADKDQARRDALAMFATAGLARPYVLYPSGSHPRKNNEALIRSFCSMLPGVRDHYQLVITSELDAPTVHHYHHLAEQAGAGESVVVAGFVTDAELVALTQGAELVCVPGLAEGFGLPIVEAQACNTAVICSDRPPFDELVAPDSRFDPTDEAAITSALERALIEEGFTNEGVRDRLHATAAPRWDAVAAASIEAFSAMLSSPPRQRRAERPLRRRRKRIAFFTPLPPAPSGVAGYNYRLLEALASTEKASIEVFAEGAGPDTAAPEGLTVHRASALRSVESLSGRFDHVIYTLGNSHHHLGALASLRRRRGVVIAHDVRLSNLYRHEHGHPGLLAGGFERALQQMYDGALPAGIGADAELSALDLERHGVLMAREVIGRAEVFFVSSEAAASLARVDRGSLGAGAIEVLPFAFAPHGSAVPGFVEEPRPAPESLSGALRARWGSTAVEAGPLVVAHFGIVDPQKLPELLIGAHARLRVTAPDALLAFVGPVADGLASSLGSLISEHGLDDHVVLTGPLGAVDYTSWLDRADIAVQLRSASNGEASSAVGECFAAGLATIVSDIGWSHELPDEAVVKLATGSTADELAAELETLAGLPGLRHALGAAAKVAASERTFAHAARALLSHLDAVEEARTA